MNRRTATALGVIALVAVGGLAPANAKPKKPKAFTGSQAFTDATIDPTPTASQSRSYGCQTAFPEGTYPHEAGIKVKVPAAGKLSAEIDNTGDWALDIIDPKGRVLVYSDGGTPEIMEAASAKAKTAGTYTILPCNLGGAPNVTVKWAYKPS